MHNTPYVPYAANNRKTVHTNKSIHNKSNHKNVMLANFEQKYFNM